MEVNKRQVLKRIGGSALFLSAGVTGSSGSEPPAEIKKVADSSNKTIDISNNSDDTQEINVVLLRQVGDLAHREISLSPLDVFEVKIIYNSNFIGEINVKITVSEGGSATSSALIDENGVHEGQIVSVVINSRRDIQANRVMR